MKDIDIPLTIGKVAHRQLLAHGLIDLGKVAEKTEQELLAIHGVGPKAIRLLKAALKDRDIPAGML